MKQIIILTPEDTYKTKGYTNIDTIIESVDGYFEICGHFTSEQLSNNVSIYCNETFLIDNSDKFSKVNAMATLLCGQPIYGNVMVGADIETEDGIDVGGFSESDLHVMTGILDAISKEKYMEIASIHKKYDKCKPAPQIGFVSCDNPEALFRALYGKDEIER